MGNLDDASRIGDYDMAGVLGRGTFAVVRLAEHKETCKKYAMKIIDPAKSEVAKIQQEIANHTKVKHRNIVDLHEALDESGTWVMVMEYVEQGDLLEYIVSKTRLDDSEARRLFRQLVQGIVCCHEQGIVHRDIKPENILLNGDCDVKVADFGLSAELPSDGANLLESCGSPNYAAPELLYRKCAYRTEVDVWSCGVVLYAMLCGALPFDEDAMPELFKKIKKGQYRIPGFVSSGASDLLAKMLTVSQAERITMAEIQSHPWFNQDVPLVDSEAEKEHVKAGNDDEAVMELPGVDTKSAFPTLIESFMVLPKGRYARRGSRRSVGSARCIVPGQRSTPQTIQRSFTSSAKPGGAKPEMLDFDYMRALSGENLDLMPQRTVPQTVK